MANLIYQNEGSAISFKETSGTYSFTPKNIANGVGWTSAIGDLGAAPRARLFKYHGQTKVAATPALNNQLRMYLCGSENGTDIVGGFATTTATVSSEDKFRNCLTLLPIDIDEASSSRIFVRQGFILIPYRYVTVGWWNATGQTLTNTAGDHIFLLQAAPDEIQ